MSGTRGRSTVLLKHQGTKADVYTDRSGSGLNLLQNTPTLTFAPNTPYVWEEVNIYPTISGLAQTAQLIPGASDSTEFKISQQAHKLGGQLTLSFLRTDVTGSAPANAQAHIVNDAAHMIDRVDFSTTTGGSTVFHRLRGHDIHIINQALRDDAQYLAGRAQGEYGFEKGDELAQIRKNRIWNYVPTTQARDDGSTQIFAANTGATTHVSIVIPWPCEELQSCFPAAAVQQDTYVTVYWASAEKYQSGTGNLTSATAEATLTSNQDYRSFQLTRLRLTCTGYWIDEVGVRRMTTEYQKGVVQKLKTWTAQEEPGLSGQTPATAGSPYPLEIKSPKGVAFACRIDAHHDQLQRWVNRYFPGQSAVDTFYEPDDLLPIDRVVFQAAGADVSENRNFRQLLDIADPALFCPSAAPTSHQTMYRHQMFPLSSHRKLAPNRVWWAFCEPRRVTQSLKGMGVYGQLCLDAVTQPSFQVFMPTSWEDPVTCKSYRGLYKLQTSANGNTLSTGNLSYKVRAVFYVHQVLTFGLNDIRPVINVQ